MKTYLLRMPNGLRDRIKIIAAKKNTSMQQLIIKILEDHFKPGRE